MYAIMIPKIMQYIARWGERMCENKQKKKEKKRKRTEQKPYEKGKKIQKNQ